MPNKRKSDHENFARCWGRRKPTPASSLGRGTHCFFPSIPQSIRGFCFGLLLPEKLMPARNGKSCDARLSGKFIRKPHNVIMNQQTFIKTYGPKLGMGLPPTMSNVQLAALSEVLIRKGVLSREELAAETESQFQKLATVIDQTPIPSPIQPHQ